VSGASRVSRQPGHRVGWTLEDEQGISSGDGLAFGQGFQLLQGKRLDLGGGGLDQGVASAIDLTAMADAHHQDHQFAPLPFVHNAVVANTYTPQPFEFTLEG
jgi:hypothetical protein